MTTIDDDTTPAPNVLDVFRLKASIVAKLANATPKSLDKSLKEVIDRIDKNSGLFLTYKGNLRKRFLVLHVAMNMQFAENIPGSTSPHARPMPHLHKDDPKAPLVSDYLNDRQIIDLNFFWWMEHRFCTHEDGAKALGSTSFDFDAASRFARYGGEHSIKLTALGLQNSTETFGASSLISKPYKELRRRTLANVPGTAQNLRNKSTSNNANFTEWSELLAAGEIITSCGKKVTGPDLVSMRAILFEKPENTSPRPDAYLDKYKRACGIFGRSLPLSRNSRKRDAALGV